MHANVRDDYKIFHVDPNKPNTFMELPSYTVATTSGRDTDRRVSNFRMLAPFTRLLTCPTCPGRTVTYGVPFFSFL